jgi:hypothetical protein
VFGWRTSGAEPALVLGTTPTPSTFGSCFWAVPTFVWMKELKILKIWIEDNITLLVRTPSVSNGPHLSYSHSFSIFFSILSSSLRFTGEHRAEQNRAAPRASFAAGAGDTSRGRDLLPPWTPMPTSGELRCCRRELLGARSAAAFTGERREMRNGSEAAMSLEF